MVVLSDNLNIDLYDFSPRVIVFEFISVISPVLTYSLISVELYALYLFESLLSAKTAIFENSIIAANKSDIVFNKCLFILASKNIFSFLYFLRRW